MKPRYLTVAARVLLVVALALIAHLATTDEAYPVVDSAPDKVNHLLAFGALALLADFSFPASRFGAAKILPLLGYGALIEAVQHFLPNREASVVDLLTDAAGIAAYAMGMPALLRVPFLEPLARLRARP